MESLIVAAMHVGLRLSDFEHLDIGMILDIIQEHAEVHGHTSEPDTEITQEGTAEDFERMF